MRDTILIVLAGGALVLSALAYQRVEELSEIVYRLDAKSNQEDFQRNRVITLGRQLEDLMRSFTGTGRKTAPPAQ